MFCIFLLLLNFNKYFLASIPISLRILHIFIKKKIYLPAMKKVELKILKINFFGRTAAHISVSVDKPINNNPKIIKVCVALSRPVESKTVLIIN